MPHTPGSAPQRESAARGAHQSPQAAPHSPSLGFLDNLLDNFLVSSVDSIVETHCQNNLSISYLSRKALFDFHLKSILSNI